MRSYCRYIDQLDSEVANVDADSVVAIKYLVGWKHCCLAFRSLHVLPPEL